MMRRATRAVLWLGAASLVILLARTIGYALNPTPVSSLLQHRAGGPALPVLVLASLVLGALFAVAICWLAALGVRERALLERRALAAPVPRLRLGRLIGVALALSIATSICGGLLEAYVHWRAGLGWHGLQCVVGPVHRDLIPIETALSLVAAALVAAAEQVGAWMRRTFALLRALPPRVVVRPPVVGAVALDVPRKAVRFAAGSPRAPPALS